jgi:hypothetical protein
MADTRRGCDVNRDRLVFSLTSFIGRTITVQLQNQSSYEGVFHGCSVEGDFSITLKSARRLPGGGQLSGEVIDTLIVPADDFLMVSAEGVPVIGSSEELFLDAKQGSTADIDDIVPQAEDDREAEPEQCKGGEVVTVEDLSVSKVDPSTISEESRKKADRIAQELESAVETAGERAEGEEVPLTEEHLCKHDSMSGDPELSSDHRKKRGIINAQSLLLSPAISEMKRINALNLEPALPKLDDQTRNDWISFKQSQSRNAAKPAHGNTSLKQEFQQSLELIRKQTLGKVKGSEVNAVTQASTQIVQQPLGQEKSGRGGRSKLSSTVPLQCLQSAGDGGQATSSTAPSPSSTTATDRKGSFSFNPAACVFTPSAASNAGPQGAPVGMGVAQAPQGSTTSTQLETGPPFELPKGNPEFLHKNVLEMLESFLRRCQRETAGASRCPEPAWLEGLEACGPWVSLI